ncbi:MULTISPECIES: GNAT family N-acetyltransferase [Sporolactobacillus]|jgi:ribosomal protein S18 acetylase RimI-like enzyme|uniref:N-acetyltransferase domain-containing protein n=3 Tax=Sporolactobacillus TaxID=2077 RepID=A0A0U1QRP5_9BACL|nr:MULTISPECIES: GNAT family N-acetyltransferase [Sporolactobacillus]KLI03480.1 hypothetical protein SINU_02565 [Sporolactobacillus inulinus CASD]QAA23468.1 GNAT family acetyltransferase [Sporolactobacillus terrae]QAA26438.1 GNAT family acetyltransferase [Sporolactobacillus terrae]UAK15532.1 GNAT family N-acetyltransferase [Sporolactobacillus terrae]BBN99918.1 acetyltransferase [Sporolactobacillus terrae]
MVTFRVLTAEDAEQYQKLRLEALIKNPEAFASDFDTERSKTISQIRDDLSKKHVMTVGGFDGEKLVAIASLDREKLPKMEHRANLTSVYVSDEYRGQRLSKRIINYIIEQVKKQGISKIYLYVMTHNEPAIRAYKKMGFTIIGEDPDAMKEDHGFVAEYRMVKYI